MEGDERSCVIWASVGPQLSGCLQPVCSYTGSLTWEGFVNGCPGVRSNFICVSKRGCLLGAPCLNLTLSDRTRVTYFHLDRTVQILSTLYDCYYCIYTLQFKGLGSARFSRSLFCTPRLNLFDQKYRKNNNIVKYYNNRKVFFILIHFKMQFIPVMAKLNFQHHYSNLQCHIILQKSL